MLEPSSNACMPPLSRRALLSTLAASSTSCLAGCNALSRDSHSPSTQSRNFGGNPLYIADGVPLPEESDPVTVEGPTGGRLALFPPELSDTAAPLRALRGSTPVAIVGRDAQGALMDICAADGRSYGFTSDSSRMETHVAAAVPYGDRLTTHRFEGRDLPRDLPQVVDEILNTPRFVCTVDTDLPSLPDEFDKRARPLGSAFIHGRTDVASFLRRDAVRVLPDADPVAIEVRLDGTIYAGDNVGSDGRYTADQVRLTSSFDDPVRATAPQDVETDEVQVRRDVDGQGGAVEHRFTPSSDEARRQFTACQHSFVTASELPDQFSYTANGRFRWRDNQFIREDDLWNHHTPGQAVWYPGLR
jgi:hypothetical protein